MKERVRRQFGAAAAAYVTSEGHARGDDLALVVRLARPGPADRALDIATGGGHTALALAPHVARVVAIDLTVEMLKAAREFVIGTEVANVGFQAADAEALPFAGATFDIVTSRIAPHHFPAPEAFVKEVARVLRPGGRFVLDDNMAPDEPDLDEFLNNFEKWRDPSHFRAHTMREWRAWLEGAGLDVVHEEPLAFKRYPYATWTARMRMPALEAAGLEEWILKAPARLQQYFRVETEPGGGRLTSISGTWAVMAAVRPERAGP